jgi:hypothetical protein
MSGTLTDPGPPHDPENGDNVDVFDDQPLCQCGCGQKAQNCPNQ